MISKLDFMTRDQLAQFVSRQVVIVLTNSLHSVQLQLWVLNQAVNIVHTLGLLAHILGYGNIQLSTKSTTQYMTNKPHVQSLKVGVCHGLTVTIDKSGLVKTVLIINYFAQSGTMKIYLT